jgi:hypothetical protein
LDLPELSSIIALERAADRKKRKDMVQALDERRILDPAVTSTKHVKQKHAKTDSGILVNPTATGERD